MLFQKDRRECELGFYDDIRQPWCGPLMHRRNSHSPLVAVCGGISWASTSLVVTLVGPAGLIREYFI